MNALELTSPPKTQQEVEALDTAKPLQEIFQPFSTTLAKWEAKAASLIVTDISQKTEMAQARLARLELKEARVTMDKTRLGLVAGLKARTVKIDTTARLIREKMEGLEFKLLESEQFAERHVAKLKAELKLKRETELAPFMDTPILGDLSDLSEVDYSTTLNNAKLARQAKMEAATKAEADRIVREEADRAERVRIAAENERLKAEAAEAARVAEEERRRIEAERTAERKKAQEEAERAAVLARKERAEIEAKARAEADKAAQEAAGLKAELAAKAKADADEKARIEVERVAADKAAKKAAAAPDKAKLIAFAESVRLLAAPRLTNASVEKKLQGEIENLARWSESAAESL